MEKNLASSCRRIAPIQAEIKTEQMEQELWEK